MVQVRRVSVCLLMVCLVLGLASAQLNVGLNCSLFTVDILGSTTDLSLQGLLPGSVPSAAEIVNQVPVKVINYRILCDASGRRRNTSSYVSVLVEFQCSIAGGTGNLAQCNNMTNITRQYQYRCSSSNVWENGGIVQTLNPMSTFQTEPTNQCRLCADPGEVTSDRDTHCFRCQNTACNQGQARCYIENVEERCCNFYLEDECTAECPAPLVPNNTTFDCECPLLTINNGGNVSFSRGYAIGSIATHTCSVGYDLVGDLTRTCTRDGWSGNSSFCNMTECLFLPTIDNGRVVVDPIERTLNARATYSCDQDFSLRDGDEIRICQAGGIWSGKEPKCELCKATDIDPDCIECAFDNLGNPICSKCKGDVVPVDGKCPVQDGNTSPSTCDTGCIVGIVLAILGAIIMAVVVALVVYAVYSYLTNPATKLAKAGTIGLNGVARDNPLYLPPDEIVGDVETA